MEVFKHAVRMIAEKLGREVEVIDCEHEFRSYHGLLNAQIGEIEQAVEEDVVQLTQFYRDFYLSGGRAIFRTALNAETLYRFRALGKAVKTALVPLAEKNILFVRDEMQGFYANDYCEIDTDTIRFSGSFSRDNFQTLARHSLAEAAGTLRSEFEIWAIYKHHLFANVIEKWAQESIPGAKVFQPNHATQVLEEYLSTGSGPDLLLIAGNEIGDILHEVLILQLGLGTRNTLYSRNVYLHPELTGLVEYQTVHGSADNLGGKQLVNPLATLRAVAGFVEEHLDEPQFGAVMDDAITAAESAGIVGHDAGGRYSTFEIATEVLNRLQC